MLKFRKIFSRKSCAVIGMIHIKPLPGTPQFRSDITYIVSEACKETEIYLRNDLDAVLVENMHDVPYIQSRHFGPEVTATMTRVCTEIRRIVPKIIPCGIQVLSCGNKEALAIAKACSFDFIRAEGFVFGHIGDEGYTDANAGQLLRYRKLIEAENVLIFADIKKKHSSHTITSDISLTETAKAAEYFLADAVVLTGTATGVPAKPEELRELKATTGLPILIGSGVTADNLKDYTEASGLIVGSYFKKNGVWSNEIDAEKVGIFMEKAKSLFNVSNGV